MDEREQKDRRRAESISQGVRIIGAEEAAAALETGEAAGRRPLDEARYGDVPKSPAGPRPIHRFPLPESVDPAEIAGSGWRSSDRPVEADATTQIGGLDAYGRHRGEGDDEENLFRDSDPFFEEDASLSSEGSEAGPEGVSLIRDAEEEDWGDEGRDTRSVPEMQHWTEPPTGEVPRILAGESGEQAPAGDDIEAWASLPHRKASWRDHDADWEDEYEPSMLADDETRVGALDELGMADRPDVFSFDLGPNVAEASAVAHQDEDMEPVIDRTRRREARRGRGSAPAGGGRGGSRNLSVAVVTGIAFGVAALILFELGAATSLFLSTVLVAMAAAECYAVLRRAGHRPATLLGLTATVSLMVAAYLKGEAAIPLVLALTVVFSFLWYLSKVVRARPTINVAMTLLGFMWVGVLGSFAALLLDPRAFPNKHGVAFLVGAVVATIAYDVGGLLIGRRGRRQLAPAVSPNKTWEGLIGGMVVCLIVSVVIVSQIHPWTVSKAAALGIVVAVVAPLGDLCQSMIKRDLGIKDMGSILPGHGGVLDRVDSLLFALPATYYLVRLLHIG